MLFGLVSTLDSSEFAPEVISLSDGGAIHEKLVDAGVRVRELGMVPGRVRPRDVARLARWTREARPDLVHAWMYHANVMGGVSAWLAGAPIVWGIHQEEPSLQPWSTLATERLGATLSRYLPARIISCSRRAVAVHDEFGFCRERMVVIPNGVDTARFRPDLAARRSMRAELRIPDGAPVVGVAARLDPQKDHATFFQAAARVRTRHPDVRFVLCGEGIEPANPLVRRWIDQAGVTEACRLLGRRDDVPRFFAAIDVAVSSSRGEGFPTVVGEAMACGVPCVVTDVGDSAYLAGEEGRVVRASDPDALGEAISAALSEDPAARRARGVRARRRIETEFALPAVAARFRELYLEVVSDVRTGRVL